MKKVMMVIIAFSLASITMLSCTQKAEDIKLSDLKTACEVVSSLGKVADAQIKNEKDRDEKDGELEESRSEISDPEALEKLIKEQAEVEKKYWDYRDVLKKKLNEIMEVAEKKYTVKELKECHDIDIVSKKLKDSGLPH
jgi:hypothetical protein